MKVRHKTPTLVSMWMLDVFCCALGCVTFLWLLNTRQASDQTVAAQSAQIKLDRTRTELADTIRQLAGLNAESERLAQRLRAALAGQSGLAAQLAGATQDGSILQGKLDEANRTLNAVRSEAEAAKVALGAAEARAATTAAELAAARQAVAAKDKELAAAALRSKSVEAELQLKKQQIDDLTKQVTAAASRVDELAKLVKEQSAARLDVEGKYLALQKELKDVEKQLAAAEARLENQSAAAKAATDKAKTDLDAAKADAAKAAQELALARKRIVELEGQVSAAGSDKATIIDLQGQNAKLANKLDRLQKDSENRFAGIAMTGRNVVFMVDISGSMTKTDNLTPNSDKWPIVCDTAAKVMRSIPTLERYQVVIFSGKARWLLPGGGNWLNFDGERSIAEVKTELLKINPNEDTNLHAAFEMAFSMRSKGLDTIYLFSDGLPTSGPGLTPSQENLPDEKREELLSQYLLRELRLRWNRPYINNERVRINSIGFFFQSPNLGAFLWTLSRENDGNFVGMSRP